MQTKSASCMRDVLLKEVNMKNSYNSTDTTSDSMTCRHYKMSDTESTPNNPKKEDDIMMSPSFLNNLCRSRLLLVHALVICTALRTSLAVEWTLGTWLRASLSCLCHILRRCMPCCLKL